MSPVYDREAPAAQHPPGPIADAVPSGGQDPTRVDDLATGEPLDAYPGIWTGTAAVPVHITASGAAVLGTLPMPVLVTINSESAS